MESVIKILVVADEVILLNPTIQVISSLGYAVFSAIDRDECFTVMEKEKPDLVLLDVMLTVTDGFEICREIKSNPSLQNPLVIFFSGRRFSSKDKQRGLESGADGYLYRGISDEELKLWIQTYARIRTVENNLRESEGRYRSLFEGSPDPILIVDREDNTIAACNSKAYTHFGYTENEFENMKIEDLETEDTKAAIAAHVQQAFDTKFRLKSGELVDISIRADLVEYKGKNCVLAVCSDLTQQKNNEEELLKNSKQLRELTHHLQNSREEQSAFIAREIHDDLGQSLTALEMLLTLFEEELQEKKIEDNVLTDLVHELREQLDSTIDKTRRLSADLRPTILDTSDLFDALCWLIHQFEKQSKAEVAFSFPKRPVSLGPERNLALFRIFQESLTNINRHANATAVTLHITVKRNILFAEIKDNGVGFSLERKEGGPGLGLLSIQERALFCGGKLKIKSEENKGSSISVEIPLEMRQ